MRRVARARRLLVATHNIMDGLHLEKLLPAYRALHAGSGGGASGASAGQRLTSWPASMQLRRGGGARGTAYQVRLGLAVAIGLQGRANG